MPASESIDDYLNSLAARTSTPGGGAVAALSGAQGCALMVMVCQFSKTGPDIEAIKSRADETSRRFVQLGQDDVRSFDAVMAAYKLPASDRQATLQPALKAAAEVPLDMIFAACSLVDDIESLVTLGNKNLITDTAIAAQQLAAAIAAARINVLVNLRDIQDTSFNALVSERLDTANAIAARLNQVAAQIDASLQPE